MSGRLRLWVPASLLGLFASATAFSDHGCLLKKPCPAPPTRIVVEMSPPEVTFVPAPSASVKAPTRPCSPSMHCFPFTVPSQPAAYAPPPAYAPSYAAAPIYAPAPFAGMPMSAPMYAPAPAFAPQAAACGMSAGLGAFSQTGTACGPGGPGALSGLGTNGLGPTVSDLRALADDLEAQERAALDRQLGVMERQYAATRARAAGLMPGNSKQSAPAAGLSPTAGPATNDQVLQELNRLKTIINRMTDLLEAHDEALKKGNLIPPARVP